MSWRARLSTNMQELRLHLCPLAPGSEGVRNWIGNNYWELSTLNPRFPLLVRDYNGIKASLIATYDWGVERRMDVENWTEEEITAKVKEFVDLGNVMEKSSESRPKDRDIIDEIDVRLNEDY